MLSFLRPYLVLLIRQTDLQLMEKESATQGLALRRDPGGQTAHASDSLPG